MKMLDKALLLFSYLCKAFQNGDSYVLNKCKNTKSLHNLQKSFIKKKFSGVLLSGGLAQHFVSECLKSDDHAFCLVLGMHGLNKSNKMWQDQLVWIFEMLLNTGTQ